MATPINPTWTPVSDKAPPLDIFDRQRIKTNLMGRVMRALRDCPDDAMRLEMLKELSSMTRLIGALDAVHQ